MSFVKRFIVIMIGCVIVAGIFFIGTVTKGQVSTGDFLLFGLVPLVFGLLVSYGIFNKNAGTLAFSVVAGGLFVYLAMIDIPRADAIWITAAIGAAAGFVLYLFQIKD